jgi:hypothetical protein
MARTMDVISVPPRSVPEHLSCLPTFLGFEAARSDEGVQRAGGDLQDLGDRRLGNPLAQQHLDLALFPVELRRADGALRATEQAAPGSRGRQPLLGPLGDSSTTAQTKLTFYVKAGSGTRAIIRFPSNVLAPGDRSWMSNNFWH